MSQERITRSDLGRALAQYVDALESLGVTYDGRHELTIGSKTNGIAYRIYRTGYLVADADGTQRRTTGHGRPVVGDDYLGMTARDAYDALTARTRAMWDLHYVGCRYVDDSRGDTPEVAR